MNCKLYQREIEHIDLVQTMSADGLRHIESCDACRGFKQEHDSLQMLLGNLERVAAPANFDTKLRARLAAPKTNQRSAFTWWNFSLLRPAVGVGFALALLIGGVVFVRPLLMNENQTFSTASKALEIRESEQINVPVKPAPSPDETVAVAPETKPSRKRFSSPNSGEGILKSQPAFGNAKPEPILPIDSPNDTISISIRPESRSPQLMLKDKKVPLRSVSFGSPTFVNGSTPRTNSSSERRERIPLPIREFGKVSFGF
jgi:hypothetical protein